MLANVCVEVVGYMSHMCLSVSCVGLYVKLICICVCVCVHVCVTDYCAYVYVCVCICAFDKSIC